MPVRDHQRVAFAEGIQIPDGISGLAPKPDPFSRQIAEGTTHDLTRTRHPARGSPKGPALPLQWAVDGQETPLMIVYSGTKAQFRTEVINNDIGQINLTAFVSKT
jgi:hypothetical protein